MLHRVRAHAGTTMSGTIPPQRPPALDYKSPDARERDMNEADDKKENENRQRIIDNESNQ